MAFNFLKTLDADDIFISYSREDGSAYLTGLDAALSKRGFSCFTDKRGTDAGRLPPETLFRKIRSCKTLVLLASPGAQESPENITPELQEFAEANGTSRIVCVSFDGGEAFDDFPEAWETFVIGKARERETADALKTGTPSEPVVEAVAAASDYMKSKDRLRQTRNRAIGVLGALVVAIAVAAVIAFFMFKRAAAATAEAAKATQEAQTALAQAQTAKTEANTAKAEADVAEANAAGQQRRADEAAHDAEEKKKLAEAAGLRAVQAEARATAEQARAEREQARAEREGAIAESRSLANRSQALLRRHPEELPRSVALAADALNKYRTGEADAALREGLALLPRLHRSESYAGDIKDAALSPDGRHFATLAADNMLRVYESGGQTPLRQPIPCSGTRVALSVDAAHAAVASHDGIRVYDLNDGSSHTLPVESKVSYQKLALSPRGRYLAVHYMESRLQPNEAFGFQTKVLLLDAASGRLVKSLADGLQMGVMDIAFGPTGDLAAGGSAFFTTESARGRVVIWLLSETLRGDETGRELNDDDFSVTFDVRLKDPVQAVAPGVDYTIFATDTAVWRNVGGEEYEPVTRIPVASNREENRGDYGVHRVALNREGNLLTVVRPVTTYSLTDQRVHRPASRPPEAGSEHLPTLGRGVISNNKLLEVWDATGHREAASMIHTYPVEHAAFGPGGQLVGTVTLGKQPGRVFRADDGTEVVPGYEASIPAAEKYFGVSPDDGFVVTAGAGAVYMREVWGTKRYTVPYAGVYFLRAVAVGAGGRFFALLDTLRGRGGEDAKPGEEEEVEVGDDRDATVIVYGLKGDSFEESARLYLKFTPRQLALTPDGQHLITLNAAAREVQIWDVASGGDVTPAGLRELNPVGLLRLSPEGRFLAVAEASNEAGVLLVLRVWRLSDGKEVAALVQAKAVSYWVFSPSGRQLLVAGVDRVVRLLDLPGGRVRRVFAETLVLASAFSRDERYLGVGDDAGVLRVYRTDDLNNEVARLQHDSPVGAVTFSDDGRLVATASHRLGPPRGAGLYDDPRLLGGSSRIEEMFARTQYPLRVWLLRREDLIAEASSRLKGLPAYAR